MPDAAALLHGQSGFLELGEYAFERIGYPTHDEAIEQGHLTAGAGTREDAACRQETVALQDAIEGISPNLSVAGLLSLCHRAGHAPPAIFDGLLGGSSRGRLEPVLHVPDVVGNRVKGRAAGIFHR